MANTFNELYFARIKLLYRVETSDGWMTICKFIARGHCQAFRNVERTLATAGAGWLCCPRQFYHVGGFPEVNEVMVAISSLHAQPRPNLDRGRSRSSAANDAN